MDDIWNELTVTIPTEDTERAAAICSMAADAGIYIEDYSDLEAEVQEIAHIDLIEKDLLEKEKVALVPGTAFSPEGEGFVRISYASSFDNLREAVTLIKRYLKNKKT